MPRILREVVFALELPEMKSEGLTAHRVVSWTVGMNTGRVVGKSRHTKQEIDLNKIEKSFFLPSALFFFAHSRFNKGNHSHVQPQPHSHFLAENPVSFCTGMTS